MRDIFCWENDSSYILGLVGAVRGSLKIVISELAN